MRLVKLTLVLLGVAIAVVFTGRLLVSFTSSDRPLLTAVTDQNPRGGCPSTDNCVSSLAEGAPWKIGPIVCPGDPDAGEAAFLRAVLDMERVEQLSDRAFIVYSRWLRFPDDVLIEQSARGLEIASSSRLGAGDIGVNRQRVEDLTVAVALDPACIGG